jgi:hypothetical protein
MDRGWVLLVAGSVLLTSQGCAAVRTRWHAFCQDRAESALLAQQMHIEETRAIKEQLQAQRSALKAEQQRELAQLSYEAEREECQVRSQMDESVRTKVELDFDQRYQLGQLQVNMDEMRRLLDEREADYQHQLDAYTQVPQVSRGPTCSCPAPLCAAPYDCPCERCGRRVVAQTEPDCAGVRPFREAPQRPQRQPITAMELPLMVPVQLEIGVTNAYVDSSEVRRLPYEEAPPQASREPCVRCLPAPPSCDAPSEKFVPPMESKLDIEQFSTPNFLDAKGEGNPATSDSWIQRLNSNVNAKVRSAARVKENH